MKFALFGNTYQAKKSAHIESLLSILEKHEAEITISREFYDFLTEDQHLSIPDAHTFEGNNFEADMVLSIGGDGTFRGATDLSLRGIPTIGVSWGYGLVEEMQEAGAAAIVYDTDELLRILEKNEVKATFFLCGYWAEKYPEEVKKIKVILRTFLKKFIFHKIQHQDTQLYLLLLRPQDYFLLKALIYSSAEQAG